MAEIVERLATLSTQFSQNVLADESDYVCCSRTSAISPDLPEHVRAAAREAAIERGKHDAWVITLSRSLIVPFLTFSDRRDLREQAFKAWTRRGENDGEHDNRPIAREILALRNELARLHGHATTPTTRWSTGWPARRMRWRNCSRRCGSRQRRARARNATRCARWRWPHGETHPIEPWDWRYYAEKVRKAHYEFDDAALKPYFTLERMLGAAFDTRQPPVRHPLRRAARPPGLSRGRSRLRSARPRRRTWSAFSCPTTSRARPSAAAHG